MTQCRHSESIEMRENQNIHTYMFAFYCYTEDLECGNIETLFGTKKFALFSNSIKNALLR